jgi:hypothetical protein
VLPEACQVANFATLIVDIFSFSGELRHPHMDIFALDQ